MKDRDLFVYGSLLSPEVVELVIGRVAESEPAVLEGYACYYVEGASFPGMVQEEWAQTNGRILFGLSEQEIAALDRYEDTFYQRLVVKVESEGKQVEVMAYVVPTSFAHVLSTQRWTWDEFRRLHLDEYLARMS